MKRTVLILCMIAVAIIGCGEKKKVRVLKLAHVLNPDHPVHKGMVFMAEKVAEKSTGQMRVDIYPGGQLGGSERDLIELLQIGSLAMAKVSAAPMEGFVPEMKVFGFPYLFRDEEHLWRVLNGEIGTELLLAGEKYFLRGLCYYDSGSRSFYTKEKPIETPEDLKGLKIRVMKSNTAMEMIRVFGGSATPIPWGELYTALQQGVVDGAENNPPSLDDSRHYEVCKYYSLDEHASIPDLLLMSTKIWQTLTPEEQTWLAEAVDESVDHQRQLWKEAVQRSLEKVQKAGVQVVRPDKAPFREAVKGMYDACKSSEPEIYELLQRIQQVK